MKVQAASAMWEEQHRRQLAEKRLQAIPNVGPAIAHDLVLLGIEREEDAAGQDPDEMYERLCLLEGVRHDPCVRDVFAAVVAYAEGGPPTPWWEFTPQRKARDRANTGSR